jgi:sodium/bile acid cotransporter 7
MLPLLLKRWFPLLMSAGVTVALLWPETLRPVVDRLPARAVVAISLFLAAWTMDGRSLVRAFLHPAAALWALVISYGLLPFLGWLTAPLLPTDDLRVGLMLATSVPCTLSSAVIWTRLAGGDEATAMLIVLLTTATSWLGTTLWLAFGTGVHASPNTSEMMRDLLVVLIVPVAMGQLSRLLPGIAPFVTRRRVLLSVAARLLIFSIILKGIVSVAAAATGLTVGATLLTAGLVVSLHLLALFGTLWLGKALGLERRQYLATAFAGSQKTLPVGLSLFEDFYKATYPLALLPLVFYHASQLVIDTFLADRMRFGNTESDVVLQPGLNHDSAKPH